MEGKSSWSNNIASHNSKQHEMAPINPAHLHPSHEPRFAHFASRRSTVFSAKGAVATSQSLGELRNHDMSYHTLYACMALADFSSVPGGYRDPEQGR